MIIDTRLVPTWRKWDACFMLASKQVQRLGIAPVLVKCPLERV